MKKKNTAFIILIILDVLLLIANLFSYFGDMILVNILMHRDKEAASIGIIGGADGPTSVFIAGSVSNTNYLLLALVIALIGTVVYIMCNKKSK